MKEFYYKSFSTDDVADIEITASNDKVFKVTMRGDDFKLSGDYIHDFKCKLTLYFQIRPVELASWLIEQNGNGNSHINPDYFYLFDLSQQNNVKLKLLSRDYNATRYD